MGWIIGILVVILALAWFLLIGPHNQLVRQRNTVQEAWRQVDVELNRRSDLIPNLVATVKGYAQQEQAVLIGVTEARAKVGQINVNPDELADTPRSADLRPVRQPRRDPSARTSARPRRWRGHAPSASRRSAASSRRCG